VAPFHLPSQLQVHKPSRGSFSRRNENLAKYLLPHLSYTVHISHISPHEESDFHSPSLHHPHFLAIPIRILLEAVMLRTKSHVLFRFFSFLPSSTLSDSDSSLNRPAVVAGALLRALYSPIATWAFNALNHLCGWSLPRLARGRRGNQCGKDFASNKSLGWDMRSECEAMRKGVKGWRDFG
jgi:hypothetical protein